MGHDPVNGPKLEDRVGFKGAIRDRQQISQALDKTRQEKYILRVGMGRSTN